MDSVGYVSDWNLVFRPSRKQRKKEMAADLTMQKAHPIYGSAAANCEVCHVEALRRVVWVLAAESQQLVKFNSELLCIAPEVLLNQRGSKAVEACGHRRVGGE